MPFAKPPVKKVKTNPLSTTQTFTPPRTISPPKAGWLSSADGIKLLGRVDQVAASLDAIYGVLEQVVDPSLLDEWGTKTGLGSDEESDGSEQTTEEYDQSDTEDGFQEEEASQTV